MKPPRACATSACWRNDDDQRQSGGAVEVSTAAGCDPVNTIFELRVYPPDERGATFAFFDLEACSHAGPIYLSVGPIKPGVGTING